ncbi:antitoxin [Marinospirillum minutulum]|uniref:antitoxin n=1 Tax=Marinospirillum minutulum TaxID=64974 RepID=UPI0003FC9132|nr:antitoxin [Marinospirillum minutulum]
MNRLNKEEQALLDAFENEELHQVSSFENKKVQHQKYAQEKLKQEAAISINLSSIDLQKLQKHALAEGVSYQKLVANILHKYLEGQLHEA